MDLSKLNATVSGVLQDIKENGDEAIKKYEEKFDHVKLSSLEVSEEEINEAFDSISSDLKASLEQAHHNIAVFHEAQKFGEGQHIETCKGVTCWQKSIAIEKVGLYIPGGTAPLFSTVLMLATPAKIAGCKEIVLCTPPNKEGKVNPAILAAAKIAGVSKIYKAGGVQAIGAMAYGTETVEPVFKIVGPGNAFVAMAKRLVFGTVGIDMIAGPSEVCCVADGSANPKWIAADLLSQAEHDPRAAVFLITPDKDFGLAVQKEMEKQMKELSRYEIMKSSVDQYAKAFLCKDAEQCFDIVNKIAPEHLEVELPDPKKYLPLIYNAGAIFLGKYTSEPIGDYMAGPNHTLPTSGTAAFSSPLGVYDFVKHSSVECYSEEAFRKISKKVQLFAKAEGLTAHAHAMEVRDED